MNRKGGLKREPGRLANSPANHRGKQRGRVKNSILPKPPEGLRIECLSKIKNAGEFWFSSAYLFWIYKTYSLVVAIPDFKKVKG
jgi:hypothetical protein